MNAGRHAAAASIIEVHPASGRRPGGPTRRPTRTRGGAVGRFGSSRGRAPVPLPPGAVVLPDPASVWRAPVMPSLPKYDARQLVALGPEHWIVTDRENAGDLRELSDQYGALGIPSPPGRQILELPIERDGGGIGAAILRSPEALAVLAGLGRRPLVAFAPTRDNAEVARRTGLQFGADPEAHAALNCKDVFRRVARSAGVPTIDHFVARDGERIPTSTLDGWRKRGHDEVLLSPLDAFGGIGARRVPNDPGAVAAEAQGADATLVQPYVAGALGSPSLQMFVHGRRAHLLATTDQVLRGCVHQGNVAPSVYRDRLEPIARRLGDALARSGLQGLFGVDLLVLPDGSVAAVECNPRWTGATAPLLAAARLFPRERKCWLADNYICVPPGTTLGSYAARLDARGVLYRGGRPEGVLITNAALIEAEQRVMAVVFADTPSRASELHAEALMEAR